MAVRSISASVFIAALLFCSLALADKDFQYFRFILTWPGSYCREDCRDGCCMPTTGDPAEDFFVKGLYPYCENKPVKGCNVTKFYVNPLGSMISELYEYWPSIDCPSNNGVKDWNSTWTTYGVCSGLDEKTYFRRALDLRNKINLLSLLKKNGIVPSYRGVYDLRTIQNVIAKGTGATVAIDCNKNKWGRSQISEINVCVDKNATNIIKCPFNVKCWCPPRVRFPPFTLDMLEDSSTELNPIMMAVSE
ncbi:ribonuclease 3-like [Magnolia sinica]|uniref:ribonuclease 3-like n=1 Tax=Magnolia sinica TaxID=86752 RepID=UPI0026596D8E|nr:ribonuclease 3-like [Magnolia sinica]